MPTLFITGASRGLGLEFVRQYADANWNIIATCRHPFRAETLQSLALHNEKIQIKALDVSDFQSISSFAYQIKDRAIDLLINNAGIYSGASASLSVTNPDASQDFGTLDPTAWDNVLRTNTISPIMVIQAFTPHIDLGQGRKIINITSRMGSLARSGPGYIAYRSSKAALNMAMLSLVGPLAEAKITIVNLHPGWVKTDMGGAEADLTPEVSVTGMRHVISHLAPSDSGKFLDYKGETIPW